MNIIKIFFSLFIISLGIINLNAKNLQLASIYNHNMVIQREKKIPVWGWAAPNTKVTVKFKNQQVSTISNQFGEWKLELQPLEADSTKSQMNVTSSGESCTLSNILVGEVWLCSGQSNMEWPVSKSASGKTIRKPAMTKPIRLLKQRKHKTGYRLKGFWAHWKSAAPAVVDGFSAVGFYFALELYEKLQVPIGIIQCAWGGSAIEPWTPPEGFASVPELKTYSAQIEKAEKAYQKDLKTFLPYWSRWVKKAEKQVSSRQKISPATIQFPQHALKKWGLPTNIFNAMVAPIVPFPIRGVIWYQGESNRWDGKNYFYKMKALINGWRKEWNEEDLPFYFVQICPYKYKKAGILPQLWQGQYRAAAEIPNCEIISAVDYGEVNNIHPANKYPVGKRLALMALAKSYKLKVAMHKYPVFKSIKTADNKLIIHIENSNGGLKTNDNKAVREFQIAGKDNKYYPAKAKISNNKITLISPKVSNPEKVKYAWHNQANPNVVNQEGLPLLPFFKSKSKND